MAKTVKEKVIFSWSGGKDSVLALQALRDEARYEVASLLTTIAEPFDRICMHGVRRSLLEEQAASLGLPCHPILVPAAPTNAAYEARFGEALDHFHRQGFRKIVFGDIFLEDLKKYRDDFLAARGWEGVYPLWKEDSRALIDRFVAKGFRAVLSCVDSRKLSATWAGREIDAAFLRELPPDVDPCGENGEYHSFVFEGPLFNPPLKMRLGRREERPPFVFCDLLSENMEAASTMPKEFQR